MILIFTRKDLNYNGQKKQFEDVNITDIKDSLKEVQKAKLVIYLQDIGFRVLKSVYLTIPSDKKFIYSQLLAVMDEHIRNIY